MKFAFIPRVLLFLSIDFALGIASFSKLTYQMNPYVPLKSAWIVQKSIGGFVDIVIEELSRRQQQENPRKRKENGQYLEPLSSNAVWETADSSELCNRLARWPHASVQEDCVLHFIQE